MRLVNYGPSGEERAGAIDRNGALRDLSSVVPVIDGRAVSKLKDIDIAAMPVVDGGPRLGPCVLNIGKLICIGLNYADHAEESGMPAPAEPVIFFKATSAVCGPNDDIVKPRGSTKLDWEVELALVVGEEVRYAGLEEAERAIAGYCVCNDISERAFQLEGTGQWVKGKSADTFGPLGPWLVTADEIADVNDLRLWLSVNGHRFQHGNTRTMLFDPVFLVSYVSRFMSLQPGDVISTGTPPGVGSGRNPPVYLNVGDVMELGIDGLGVQRQTVVSGVLPR